MFRGKRAEGPAIRVYLAWEVDTIPDGSWGPVSIYLSEDSSFYMAYVSDADGHLCIAHKKVIPNVKVVEELKGMKFKSIRRAGEDIRMPWRWGYELYDAGGRMVRRGPGPEVSRLRRGGYILKLGETARRIVVR